MWDVPYGVLKDLIGRYRVVLDEADRMLGSDASDVDEGDFMDILCYLKVSLSSLHTFSPEYYDRVRRLLGHVDKGG